MNQQLRMLFASAVICGAATAAPPRDFDAFMDMVGRRQCELQDSRRIVYAGPTEELGACLGRLDPSSPIQELRITSGGGDAWLALQLARDLRGRLDLLVVDGVCASSCANYLLPAAKRVRVEPHSYVLLHGSMSQRDATSQHESIRESVRAQLRAKPAGQDISDAEIESMAQLAIDTLHADLTARIPVQQAFAREVLGCDDWLDIWQHFGGKSPPPGIYWVMVTPEMARRCLKSAQVEAFWAPEGQQAFNPELGFFRARK